MRANVSTTDAPSGLHPCLQGPGGAGVALAGLLDRDGFFAPLMDWLARLRVDGYIRTGVLESVIVEHEPGALLDQHPATADDLAGLGWFPSPAKASRRLARLTALVRALLVWLVIIAVQATLNHVNMRFDIPVLNQLLVMPRFHHWHHAMEPIDKNFAVHFPWIDRLFGTFHMPKGEWPQATGIHGDPVPADFARQLVWPFRR